MFQDKADRLHDQAEKAAASQARQQRAVIGLSVVLALATIAYTVITAWSVLVLRDANDIQRAVLATQQHSAAPAASATNAPLKGAK